ncbi:MAG: coproporphyrinogen III oxidase [Deltaproteobacteria bacterium RBG_13_61_14]|nr:MAG: coproporphyrinogen III oxidase [Deltaproteobacteria bacterium RBG_13_61_14]
MPPGFEQGPIRPPSEAYSLLLRVTRNCPWNRCAFCPVYKPAKFSRRSREEVLADIQAMRLWLDEIKARSWQLGAAGDLSLPTLAAVERRDPENPYLRALLLFLLGGAETVFLQDADSLVIPTDNLVAILQSLRETFPTIQRITSYARAQTLSRRTKEELTEIRKAGLNRIHVGLESGSDRVLEKMSKGVTAERQIRAGRNVKAAGMELSEYVMPGLGGRELWQEHALETARVLNAIAPDFIRLRSLAVPPGAPLFAMVEAGEFQPPNDLEIARELRLFLESLEGITSRIVSDHILNLFPEIEGRLPEDQPRLLALLDRFLRLGESEQMVYILGRRLGLMDSLDDREREPARGRVLELLARLQAKTHDDLDRVIREVMTRFI